MKSTETLYKDYWQEAPGERQGQAYYDRLYRRLKHKLVLPPHGKILDVAGGNGQNLRYLEVNEGDVLDISDSGLRESAALGFGTIKANIEKRFPIKEAIYDAALCFEVLEHLYHPNKTLSEINNVLKTKGLFYVAQPNMRPDGVYHVRRYRLAELLEDLNKAGFSCEWVDFVPAYTMRDAILHDIRTNPSWVRKLIQCVNLVLSLLPWGIRYQMARLVPDRFALMFVVKARKKI